MKKFLLFIFMLLFSVTVFAKDKLDLGKYVKLNEGVNIEVTEKTYCVFSEKDAEKLLNLIENKEKFFQYFEELLKKDKAGVVEKGAILKAIGYNDYFVKFIVPEIKEDLWIPAVYAKPIGVESSSK